MALVSARPAPVQASFKNFVGTLGAPRSVSAHDTFHRFHFLWPISANAVYACTRQARRRAPRLAQSHPTSILSRWLAFSSTRMLAPSLALTLDSLLLALALMHTLARVHAQVVSWLLADRVAAPVEYHELYSGTVCVCVC